jgi:LysR family transcriptional activator for leuABCD operon
MILQQIDAVAILPRAMAEAAAEVYDLKIFTDPCSNTSVPMSLIWHERADGDKGILWFRNLFSELSARGPTDGNPLEGASRHH